MNFGHPRQYFDQNKITPLANRICLFIPVNHFAISLLLATAKVRLILRYIFVVQSCFCSNLYWCLIYKRAILLRCPPGNSIRHANHFIGYIFIQPQAIPCRKQGFFSFQVIVCFYGGGTLLDALYWLMCP